MSSTSKQQRSRPGSTSRPQKPFKPRGNPEGVTQPKPKSRKKKKEVYLIPRAQISKEMKGTQRAFQVHICLAFGITSAASAPTIPPGHLKQDFNARFQNEQVFSDLVRNLKQRPFREPPMARIQEARRRYFATAATGNSLCKDVSLVEDMTLSILFAMMEQYGFSSWCPDLSESPSSLYNNAHRTFAIDSFQQACAMGGYRRFGIDSEYWQSPLALIRIYDSYVFVTIKDKSRREAREPGALERQLIADNVGRRRRAQPFKEEKEREMWARSQGWAERAIKDIAGAYCASEDEGPVTDPNGTVQLLAGRPFYYKHQVPGRSDPLTRLVQRIREDIVARGTGGSLIAPNLESGRKLNKIVVNPLVKRLRVDPEKPILPTSRYLPTDVSLDFFGPENFNKLSILDRAIYGCKPYFAFPPGKDGDWLFENQDKWARLSNKEFDDLYGSQIFGYNIPTKDEVDRFLDNDNADTLQEEEDAKERAAYRAGLEADLAARMNRGKGKKRARNSSDDDDDEGEDLYGESFERDYREGDEDEEEEEERSSRHRAKRSRHRSRDRNEMEEEESHRSYQATGDDFISEDESDNGNDDWRGSEDADDEEKLFLSDEEEVNEDAAAEEDAMEEEEAMEEEAMDAAAAQAEDRESTTVSESRYGTPIAQTPSAEHEQSHASNTTTPKAYAPAQTNYIPNDWDDYLSQFGLSQNDMSQLDPSQYGPAQYDSSQTHPSQSGFTQNLPAQYDFSQYGFAQDNSSQNNPAQYDPSQYDPSQYDPSQYDPSQYGFSQNNSLQNKPYQDPSQYEPAQEPSQNEPFQDPSQYEPARDSSQYSLQNDPSQYDPSQYGFSQFSQQNGLSQQAQQHPISQQNYVPQQEFVQGSSNAPQQNYQSFPNVWNN